jgi:hypothetical protein
VAADPQQTRRDFDEAVNMTASEIETFLDTPESQEVGWKGESGHEDTESIGHQSGRRIAEIKRKKAAEINEDDIAHMRKVVSYVHRHTAQGGPKDDKEHSRWRYSLMNWGHDPLKG